MTPALTSKPIAPSSPESPAPEDHALLAKFAAGDEDAFTELVGRHIDLVYSAALRQVRDAHTAGDVTSAVFVVLARKASQLSHNVILAAWLHRTTRYAALKALRAQARRKHYEEEAAHMQESLRTEEIAAVWEEVAPLLDDALTQLSSRDHEAVALRFFQNKTYPQIAQLLGGAEDGARKRVDRAVEKLRRLLSQRGVNISGSLLVEMISKNSIRPAPVTLAASLRPLSGASSMASLANETLRAIRWRTWKQVLGSLAALLVASGILLAVTAATASSPRESFRVLKRAGESGDAERWSSFINVTTPEERQLLPLLASNFVAQAEVRRALIQRFGQREYELSDFPRLLDDAPENEIASAIQTFDGVRSILHFERGSDLQFIKSGDVWKFDFFRTTSEPPEQLRVSLQRNVERLSGATLRLKQNAYPTLRSAAIDFRNR